MLLNIGSLLLVLLITSYCLFHFYRNKERLSGPIEKVTSLLIGVSTATIGFLLMQTSSYHLPLTIVVCLLFALGTGFLVRRLFDNERGINETVSGLLGATLGSVIGYMTFISSKPFLIMDVIFILSIYLLLLFFDKQMVAQSKKKGPGKKGKHPSTSPSVVLSVIFLFVLIILGVNMSQINVGIIGQPQNQTTTIDENNDLQVATIHVTPSGFDPKNTTLTSKTMMRINFDVDTKMGSNVQLISNDLKLNVNLKSGKNMILLDNPVKGKYHFMLEKEKTSGTFTVMEKK